MTGQEQIPEAQRQRYATDERFDNGEEQKPQSFEDDGHGYCLHCRRSIIFHREAAFCRIGAK